MLSVEILSTVLTRGEAATDGLHTQTLTAGVNRGICRVRQVASFHRKKQTTEGNKIQRRLKSGDPESYATKKWPRRRRKVVQKSDDDEKEDYKKGGNGSALALKPGNQSSPLTMQLNHGHAA